MTDPVSDYLTRLRNAIKARHRVVEVPSSSLKKNISKILLDKGFILGYREEGEGVIKTLKVALKYDSNTKQPAIVGLRRVSRPGLRKYSGATTLPRVINGLGVAIISTSKGVMTDKEAKNLNIGG
jgi:small subunit ribosomal protein S8